MSSGRPKGLEEASTASGEEPEMINESQYDRRGYYQWTSERRAIAILQNFQGLATMVFVKKNTTCY
jgi:hypothetical protein